MTNKQIPKKSEDQAWLNYFKERMKERDLGDLLSKCESSSSIQIDSLFLTEECPYFCITSYYRIKGINVDHTQDELSGRGNASGLMVFIYYENGEITGTEIVAFTKEIKGNFDLPWDERFRIIFCKPQDYSKEDLVEKVVDYFEKKVKDNEEK